MAYPFSNRSTPVPICLQQQQQPALSRDALWIPGGYGVKRAWFRQGRTTGCCCPRRSSSLGEGPVSWNSSDFFPFWHDLACQLQGQMWISRRKKGVMNLNVESTWNWGAPYSAFRMAMHPAKEPSRSLRGRGPVPTHVSFGTSGVFEANEWSRFQILTARTQSLTVRK